MKSKKNFLAKIDIIFWGIIIINVIVEFSKSFIKGDLGIDISMIEMFGIKEYLMLAGIILFILFFLTIVSLLKMFYLTILYIGIKIGYKKYFKEKLDKIDFKNDNYYREIISQYSPGVLSYIDDFKLDEKDIVATLMSLELKHKIKISNNDIEVIEGDEEDLDENEKYILDNISNNKLKNIDIKIFEKKVINDCKNYNLLEEKKDVKKKIKRKVFACIIAYALISVAFYLFPEIVNKISGDNGIVILLLFAIMLIIFFVMAILPFSTFIYIKSYYIMTKIDPYVRNQSAKEINSKLEGLKKYIKEYSLLDKKEYKDIVIWENYLIYSVILGENTEIVNQVLEKIK